MVVTAFHARCELFYGNCTLSLSTEKKKIFLLIKFTSNFRQKVYTMAK